MRATNLVFFCFGMCCLTACTEKVKDVSGDLQYKNLLGIEYEIVGPVDAYGIRHHSKAPVDYATLVPPPGFEGSEVGFRVPVALGSKITIRRVLRVNRLFDPPMRFVVELEGTRLPANGPVIIDIFRGSQGKGDIDLNPGIYRRSK